jgi:predicted PurR-regulated permease PerM
MDALICLFFLVIAGVPSYFLSRVVWVKMSKKHNDAKAVSIVVFIFSFLVIAGVELFLITSMIEQSKS